MTQIKFGTDGWRAIIGEAYTPDNVMQVAQAFADLYPHVYNTGHEIFIGYDRRAMSKESAELVASVLTANKIRTVLSDNFCPTPAVSYMTQSRKGTAGIMITASHNPANYNGIKFKESYGGAACPEYVKPIEEQIARNMADKKTPKTIGLHNEYFSNFNPHHEYTDAIQSLIDLKAIQAAGFKVLAEPMYGAGTGYFPHFLGSSVKEIHNAADTTFGGLQPEPIPPHVNEAIGLMKEGGYDLCAITDGDADRIGLVDEKGNFVNSHQIYTLILKHLVQHKKWTGTVIKTVTTTRMLNQFCKKNGLELVTTPVGFKYISPMLNTPNAMIGGEESGGIGIKRHICERDGVFCGLLAMEIMAIRQKSLSSLVEELWSEFGHHYYQRNDLHLDNETVAIARKRLNESNPAKLAGKRVAEHSTIDGHHFLLEDDSWLLIRGSGTEPLLRTYAEAGSPDQVKALLDEARQMIGLA